jgi:signal transduction histidine kinase
MALRTEQKLPLILFVVFLTLSTVGFLFYQSQASFQEALLWQRQTNDALRQADEIGRSSMLVERSLFGFSYTGVDTYLDGYSRARAVIVRNLSDLKQDWSADPDVAGAVGALEGAVNAALREADQQIEARKIGGPDAGADQIRNISYRPQLDAVQSGVRHLKDSISAKGQAKDLQMDTGLSRSVGILVLASLAGIFALGFANFVVFREIKKRQTAETELLDTNKSLEQKVEERTEELVDMNERLLEIGSERELLLKGEKTARQEAEVANRLRDEFMATVSHELRTPLNSILGWARLLKDGTLDHSQTQRAVNTIIKNSETQNRLIEDLLDVARLISGKLELKEEPVDLISIVSDSIEIARPAAQQKHIRIEFDGGAFVNGPIVSGDSSRLRQVFSNLLTNAVKFSHDGREIVVEAHQDASVAVVSVADEGVGISKEFIPLVFERFRQDVNSPERNGGLGLGLAIVRNLVEMHGGSVSVESEGENKGTKFTVRLPLDQNGRSV